MIGKATLEQAGIFPDTSRLVAGEGAIDKLTRVFLDDQF